MGIDLNRPLGVGGISSNMAISPFRMGFGSNNYADSFQSTSVSRYATEPYIRKAIAENPEIKKILKEMNADGKLNIKELEYLLQNHAKATQDIAVGITGNLPKALKEHVNMKSLKDAAYLHDLGKVLIPAEVLNKNGKLTEKEAEIMHRHSELGYELLKKSDIDTRTLHLVKYHHQNSSHTGYPKVKDDFWADVNLQILNVADKYSALTEDRAYKKAYEPQQALAIIYKDVKAGNLHPFIFKALVDYVGVNSKQPLAQIA